MNAAGPAPGASRRLAHIDIARGISIALVVFSHGALRHQLDALNSVLASFRMPLFFMLAGLFMHTGLKTRPWLHSKTDALLKPYAVTLLAYSAARLLAGRSDPPAYYLGMLEGNGSTLPETFIPLWFLPHLWLVSLLGWAVLRLARARPWPEAGRAAALLAMLLAGIATLGRGPMLPWGLDLCLVSGAFVLAGVAFKDRVFALGAWPRSRLWQLMAGGVLVLVAMHLLGPSSVDLNLRRWDHPLRATLAAGAGIGAALAAASLLATSGGLPARLGGLLTTLGRASLLILLFHYLIQAYAWKWLDAAWPGHPWLTAIAAYGCGLWLPVWLGRGLIERWLAALWLPRRTSR